MCAVRRRLRRAAQTANCKLLRCQLIAQGGQFARRRCRRSPGRPRAGRCRPSAPDPPRTGTPGRRQSAWSPSAGTLSCSALVSGTALVTRAVLRARSNGAPAGSSSTRIASSWSIWPASSSVPTNLRTSGSRPPGIAFSRRCSLWLAAVSVSPAQPAGRSRHAAPSGRRPTGGSTARAPDHRSPWHSAEVGLARSL